jgi:hypothetical protein
VTRRGALLLAAAALAGCAVQRRATDPQPTLPSLTESEALPPVEAEEEAPPVAALPAALPAAPLAALPAAPTAPPPGAAAARAAPPRAKKRLWGLVAITTAVISPSQLVGSELPYSPDYRRLPVFPEKLTLDVSWGLLSVGEATLGVDKIVMFNGRPAYHIVSEARSNSFCDTFYSVRDLNESWLDARTLTSLGYSKRLREGRYYRDVWVLYDRDAGTFVERQTAKDGSFSIKTGTIPASVQDILSSVYFLRSHELPDGGRVIVDVNTPDNWPLVVRVTKREQVKALGGRRDAVLVEPAMRREGLFIQKGKRLRLWLSDDAERRPLVMKVEVFFGHITAVLREMI